MSGNRCSGELVWHAWKVKQLNNRPTGEIACRESRWFQLSAWVLNDENQNLKMNDTGLSTLGYPFSPQTKFEGKKDIHQFHRTLDTVRWGGMTWDWTWSQFLSVSVRYLCGQTLTVVMIGPYWARHGVFVLTEVILEGRAFHSLKFHFHFSLSNGTLYKCPIKNLMKRLLPHTRHLYLLMGMNNSCWHQMT